MTSDPTGAVAALLSETEAAHGVFEATVLGGVYDQAWARWYAAHAVEHGIGALVGHPIAIDRLAGFLATSFGEFTATEPDPSESWAAYAARRIVAEM
jgi:hypothetical protein